MSVCTYVCTFVRMFVFIVTGDASQTANIFERGSGESENDLFVIVKTNNETHCTISFLIYFMFLHFFTN